MLLIDDDESKIGKRRKKRRSGTDHNVRLSISGPLKLVTLFSGRKPGMHNTDTAAETAVKTAHRRVGQGNLRNQHNRLFSLPEYRLDQFHIYFCLAASRNTMDQTWTFIP